ncbi:hypothetical protein LCM20_15450 [Halobacillus litoralis]|uniref:hypothetical protein n=1 Tax=Halobacillus litoralis TaxID=45668 RepID=UPI001CD69038|nr:hypothetical protein [Halobacillus litoralis]MCA0972001.1 hypothetical protein [Halobacillus litoralis]
MIFDILFMIITIPAVGMILAIANDRIELQSSTASVIPTLKLVISNPPNALKDSER